MFPRWWRQKYFCPAPTAPKRQFAWRLRRKNMNLYDRYGAKSSNVPAPAAPKVFLPGAYGAKAGAVGAKTLNCPTAMAPNREMFRRLPRQNIFCPAPTAPKRQIVWRPRGQNVKLSDRYGAKSSNVQAFRGNWASRGSPQCAKWAKLTSITITLRGQTPPGV
jgi:hypothetical protein